MEPRHAARLLAVTGPEASSHQTVWELQGLLQPGDLLVVNNTRVLKARLQARRASGGAVELLVLEPVRGSDWLCLAKPAKRLKPGDVLQLEHGAEASIPLEIVSVDEATGGRVVRFPAECTSAEAIEAVLREVTVDLPIPSAN